VPYPVLLLQELSGERAEGEQRIARVKEAADKVLLETAPSGQAQISRAVAGLSQDFETLVARVATTERAQQTAYDSWQQFDTLSDSLTTWLRDTELQLTDQSLKATLADKQDKLAHFQVCVALIPPHITIKPFLTFHFINVLGSVLCVYPCMNPVIICYPMLIPLNLKLLMSIQTLSLILSLYCCMGARYCTVQHLDTTL
jgi:hypothetical protein